jgi:4-amino-4-deoxy-L-arabinose transferase-like glycosyltransferase
VKGRGVPWSIAGVALAGALLALPFLGSYPLFDPDEAFYAASAAESVDAGRPLDLTFNGEPRWNKPPLAYALIEASFALLGRNEFAARLPSVLEAALLAALFGLLVRRVAGDRAGLFTVLVLSSAVGHQAMGRAAHPEMGLVLGIAIAEMVLARWFIAPAGKRPSGAWWAAGLAMGLAFLAKGPISLLLPALMLGAGLLVVPRGERPTLGEAARVFGLAAALALAVAAPWYLWMGSKHGKPFWDVALGQLAHVTSAEHTHFADSPVYFVPVLVGAFLPWTFFLPGALKRLRPRDPSPRERLRLLMALAAGTSFLFWSLSRSKLPHYGLVFLPPLAVIVAVDLRSLAGSAGTAAALRSRLPCLGLAALGVLVVAAPALFGLSRSEGTAFQEMPDGTVLPIDTSTDDVWNGALAMSAYLGGALLVAGGGFGLFISRQTPRILAIAASWLLLVPLALGWWSAFDRRERPAREFAAAVRAEGAPGDGLAVYRRRLPSFTFYAGRTVRWPGSPADLAEVLDGPERTWLVVQRRHLPGLKGILAGRTETVRESRTLVLLRER